MLFQIDFDKLNSFLNGNVGIADELYKTIQSAVELAPKSAKEKYKKDTEPDKDSGIYAIERVIIKSYMESQKPFIEIAKLLSELFAYVDIAIAAINLGRNPEYIEGTLAYSFFKNKAISNDIYQYVITKFYDAEGKFDYQLTSGNLTLIQFEQYKTKEINTLKDKIKSLSLEQQTRILNTKLENLEKEYDTLPKVIIDDVEYVFDKFEDYDEYIGSFKIEKVGNKETTTITFKQDADRKSIFPEFFNITNQIQTLIKLVTSKITKVVNQVIDIIIQVNSIINEGVGFIGKLIVEQLNKEIKFSEKFFYKNKFLLNGEYIIPVIGLRLFLDEEGKFGFDFNTIGEGKPSQLLNLVGEMVAFPFKVLFGIIEFISEFIIKLLNPFKIPEVIEEFLTFEWIMKYFKEDFISKALGGSGTYESIPLFKGVVNAATEGVGFFKKLINALINIFNTLFNKQVIPNI